MVFRWLLLTLLTCIVNATNSSFNVPPCYVISNGMCVQPSCNEQICSCFGENSCKQNCEKCDNSSLHCKSDFHCDQTVSNGGNATLLAAQAPSITQRCTKNSKCGEIKCSSRDSNGTCLQVCDGRSTCNSMECDNMTSCTLYCDTNSICHSMTCHQNVSECHLECVSGATCNMTCLSLSCSFICHVGSMCHYSQRNVTFPGPPEKPGNSTAMNLQPSIGSGLLLSTFVAMSLAFC